MGNIFKNIDLKKHTHQFNKKKKIEIKLKQMKTHTKILLFTTLHM